MNANTSKNRNSKAVVTSGRRLSAFFFVLAAFFVIITGCATVEKDLQGQRDPKELYDKGLAAYVSEDYEDSEKYFKKLMEDHPLSQYALEAQLTLGDVYYASEKYDDASSYYTNFVALHPSHHKADYALFQKGMSHFKDILSLDRDQTATRKALFAFQDLVASYPGSVYADKSKELAGFLKRRLADREYYIARFYFKGKNYKGALSRFRDILRDYPDVGLTEETLYYIGESYIRLGETKLAQDAFTTLINNFPDSPLIKDAKNRLTDS